MKYRIVETRNKQQLVERVQGFLDRGWEPLGPPIPVVTRDVHGNDQVDWYQALTGDE